LWIAIERKGARTNEDQKTSVGVAWLLTFAKKEARQSCRAEVRKCYSRFRG
jgi:hypothetical protein